MASSKKNGLDLEGLRSFLASLKSEWPPEKRFERLLPGASNNEARSLIDADIANIARNMGEVAYAIAEATTSLRSRRNNEAPINTLPEKLLTTVFDLACDSGFDHRCITRISWTCAMWREISLGTPSLWRCIDFSLNAISPRIAELFVERNKDLPRSVKIHDPRSPTSIGNARRDRYQTLLRQNTDTIQDLSLGCSLPNVWSLKSSDLGTSPVLLRSLFIFFVEHTSNGGFGYSTSTQKDHRIDDILEECPHLEKLTLNGIILPTHSVLYTHLKILKITLPPVNPDTLEIFFVLRQTRSLEVLFFHVDKGESIFTDEARARSTESVSLTSLAQITLELPSYDIVYILSGLELGLSTRISLKDTTASTQPKASEDLLPLDPRCLPGLASAKKLSIDREGSKVALYRSSGAANILEDAPFVEYSIGSRDKVKTSTITHLLINLRHVEELVLIDRQEESSKFSAGDLLILLAMVPDLRCLQLEACSSEVCRPLAAQAQSGRPKLCRLLEILHLKNMKLDEKEVVGTCASLAPHVRSVTVQDGRFTRPKQDVMGVLKAVCDIEFQVISSHFNFVPTPAVIRKDSESDDEGSVAGFSVAGFSGASNAAFFSFGSRKAPLTKKAAKR